MFRKCGQQNFHFKFRKDGMVLSTVTQIRGCSPVMCCIILKEMLRLADMNKKIISY